MNVSQRYRPRIERLLIRLFQNLACGADILEPALLFACVLRFVKKEEGPRKRRLKVV
jgi:hypothetical protein